MRVCWGGPPHHQLSRPHAEVYKNLYDAVIVDELGLKRLRDMRVTAGKLTPLVLIPTHRSYIDFLMLSFLLFAYELPLPQIAAGDDFLDMAGVNWIFRHSGAFFLKRSFRNDLLYRSIFEEYVQQLLLHGHTLEFFIEGTRSRTGKNLPPKVRVVCACACRRADCAPPADRAA
jgi:glycerol-3-phosphate O-acyltransferase